MITTATATTAKVSSSRTTLTIWTITTISTPTRSSSSCRSSRSSIMTTTATTGICYWIRWTICINIWRSRSPISSRRSWDPSDPTALAPPPPPPPPQPGPAPPPLLPCGGVSVGVFPDPYPVACALLPASTA